MCARITGDEVGKRVVNANGDEVGMVTVVEGDVAHVEPNPGIVASIKATIGWDEPGPNALALDEASVAEVTGNEVRLRGDLPASGGESGADERTGATGEGRARQTDEDESAASPDAERESGVPRESGGESARTDLREGEDVRESEDAGEGEGIREDEDEDVWEDESVREDEDVRRRRETGTRRERERGTRRGDASRTDFHRDEGLAADPSETVGERPGVEDKLGTEPAAGRPDERADEPVDDDLATDASESIEDRERERDRDEDGDDVAP